MEFKVGDVLRHQRPGRVSFYLITGVEDGSEPEYQFSAYDRELFENFIFSGSRGVEYIEKRIAMDNEELEEALQGTDVEYRSNWDYVAPVQEMEPMINIGNNHPYYTIDMELMKDILLGDEFGGGWRAIKDAQLYYETAGTQRTILVRRVGHSRDDLVGDIAILSEVGDSREIMESKGNILSAVRMGIWIPIRSVESKVDGRKVSQI